MFHQKWSRSKGVLIVSIWLSFCIQCISVIHHTSVHMWKIWTNRPLTWFYNFFIEYKIQQTHPCGHFRWYFLNVISDLSGGSQNCWNSCGKEETHKWDLSKYFCIIMYKKFFQMNLITIFFEHIVHPSPGD